MTQGLTNCNQVLVNVAGNGQHIRNQVRPGTVSAFAGYVDMEDARPVGTKAGADVDGAGIKK